MITLSDEEESVVIHAMAVFELNIQQGRTRGWPGLAEDVRTFRERLAGPRDNRPPQPPLPRYRSLDLED